MFEQLKPQPADKIIALMKTFREDPREDKIDLGVGVYKNAQGTTPVMRAVKTAEKMLWESENTKAYTGLIGDPGFYLALSRLVLGQAVPTARQAWAAQPGGTGAIRQAMELIRMARPGATVWLPDPTWPNHPSIIRHVGLQMRHYRYFDPESRGLDFAGMIEDLARVRAGDVVLVHGCCHNPTGANPTPQEWHEIVAVLQKTGAVALIDIAYQGFGDGLEEDAAATRLIASSLPESLIAASCSKNFGIYRERTGLLVAVSENARQAGVTQQNLTHLNRQNFSFPPDHGARVVSMILTDEKLRADWESELEDMRRGMLELRERLAAELRRTTGSDRYGFLAQHRGMFSRLGASPAQVETLRERYGIYMVSDSRMNIAGLNPDTATRLAEAIADLEI